MQAHRALSLLAAALGLISFNVASAAETDKSAKPTAAAHAHHHHAHIHFDVKSTADGKWSDAKTWSPPRVPQEGDRVLIARGTQVQYDVENKAVLRMVQIVGTLTFARDRSTEINVGLLKVQNSDECSESGFQCDFEGVTAAGEPTLPRIGTMPKLEVGTLANPIPVEHTAKIRLHYIEGMNKEDAPALVCCSAQMELHGAPLSRTWIKLAADAAAGDGRLTLAEPIAEWKVGDEIIVTSSKLQPRRGTRPDEYANVLGTEERRITKVDGATIEIDKPLSAAHSGSGEFRCEVANLSRNVIVESADPAGVRGHTMYHAFSKGGISYARFAHLGKEKTLGRYAIHFHLLGDSMRGSQVLGVAIVDSHNRWVTIHGTEYLTVRDCVGFRSAGHGFFMEDGTEIYNLFDRNLAVQAYRAKPLPKQVLPFDQNEGAGFWWANGRNTIVRNVACENDEYGFRYDMQHTRYSNAKLPITMPDGTKQELDVRTIPNWRFEDNEAHCDGVAGLVIACNGGQQPDTPIRDQAMLDRIKAVDWTGPDAKHPHIVRNFKVWETHYAFRPHSPSMLIDGLRIYKTVYGIYRPAFDNHEYRNVHLTRAGGEPFNRGMDDASSQVGVFTVDGLTIDDFSKASSRRNPIVQMSDNNLTGKAESHFRNVTWTAVDGKGSLFNRGGQTRGIQFVDQGVPYFLHDYYGVGRTAKVVSTSAKDLLADGNQYREEPPLTGDESVVAEVSNVPWPKLLDPTDDVPPATIVTLAVRDGKQLRVTGISHDDGEITKITVNGAAAEVKSRAAGVVDWTVTLPLPKDGKLSAHAVDAAGNVERTAHTLTIE